MVHSNCISDERKQRSVTINDLQTSYHRRTDNDPLNENSNVIQRRNGLPKSMDFRKVNQTFITRVSNQRNHITRKSLNYRTPIEIFLSYVQEAFYSSLI